jgi:hypothetical protein
MPLYPGAVFKPTQFGGRTPRNRQERGVLHVAVSRARALAPWNENTWHFYVAADGYCEQYVDTAFRAWADVTANDDAIAIETAGGVGTSDQVNAERWTGPQAARLADLMRWAQATDGVPFTLLPDSLPGRTGWGPHRLGIDPWRVSGGEVWSSSRGKLCPGDAKVAQIPELLTVARGGVTPRPPGPNPVPPPVVHVGAPVRLGWNLPGTYPTGDYYGNILGGVHQHGGFYTKEQGFVRNIQQWLVYHGCAAGIPSSAWASTGWVDGKWQSETDGAMSEWHRRFYPGQPKPAVCWADDYSRLARP